jgi:hypothetical protein
MAEESPGLKQFTYGYVVVLSQSCDLMQDFNGRKDNKPQLEDVLLCQAPTAEELRATCGGSDIWKRIRQNKDERYHFLEAVLKECDACNEDIPEVVIDFKRYFSMPTAEIYKRLEVGPTCRRTVICTPFLEHLASRFAYFLGRIALPREHVSK